MRLIIFDIDGTLLHYHPHEVACFEQALFDVAGIRNISKDLQTYQHVTDIGIAMECFERHLQRPASPTELQTIEDKFLLFFNTAIETVSAQPITGVQDIFTILHNTQDCAMAIATGCSHRSALIKLRLAGIDVAYPIATSNDSYIRTEIMNAALIKAKAHYLQSDFHSITYVGDGPWDIACAKALGWEFVGIASNYSQEQLQKWGALRVIEHYNSPNALKMLLD
jgi:phosphoglycolate phosphatase-like HAD superfamily hydrolase